jgi:NAD(P)-dependent dehydrogenase (short-subunit alcohol dehydrogenase family)
MVMGDRVKGKCLIYGGGTGIGLACAEALIREGLPSSLAEGGKMFSRPLQLILKLGKAGHAAGDATSVADVQRITASAADFLGGLDTIVISAGRAEEHPCSMQTR